MKSLKLKLINYTLACNGCFVNNLFIDWYYKSAN